MAGSGSVSPAVVHVLNTTYSKDIYTFDASVMDSGILTSCFNFFGYS